MRYARARKRRRELTTYPALKRGNKTEGKTKRGIKRERV